MYQKQDKVYRGELLAMASIKCFGVFLCLTLWWGSVVQAIGGPRWELERVGDLTVKLNPIYAQTLEDPEPYLQCKWEAHEAIQGEALNGHCTRFNRETRRLYEWNAEKPGIGSVRLVPSVSLRDGQFVTSTHPACLFPVVCVRMRRD